MLEDAAILDGEELAAPLLLASWTRHAVSELTVHDLATGEQLPGLGSLGGIVERPALPLGTTKSRPERKKQ
jgi:prolyl oligopeptidase